MFMVNEEQATAVRIAYQTDGEEAAATELRRHFPGLADNENTRICARSIAGWEPPPEPSPR